MMFSTGLKKIYESIGKQPEQKRKGLLNNLYTKISANEALSYKFKLLEAIRSKKNSMSKEQAAKFLQSLKENHQKFLKDKNSVALFYKAEKGLFEHFNVNAREVVSSKLDLIVNKKDNQLNESLILEWITDPSIISRAQYLQENKQSIKESFQRIAQRENLSGLELQLEAVKMLSAKFDVKMKGMIAATIKSIKESVYVDFKTAVNGAYKLRMLTEKQLLEYDLDPLEKTDDEDLGRTKRVPQTDDEATLQDDDYWNNLENDNDIKGTTFKNEQLGLEHLSNINITVPTYTGKPNEQIVGETIELKFNLLLYPNVIKQADVMKQALRMEDFFQNYKLEFMKRCVFSNGIKTIDPVDVNYQIFVTGNNMPEKPGDRCNKEIEARGYYSQPVTFTILFYAKKAATTTQYREEAVKILSTFNSIVPTIDKISNFVTPDEQIEVIQKAKEDGSWGQRAKEYKNSGDEKVKYYKDKRQTMGSDNWTDDWFTGSVEDSEVDPHQTSLDKEASAAKNKKATAPAPEDNGFDSMDDDEIARQAEKNAKAGKFSKAPVSR